MVIAIFSYALIAGQTGSFAALVFLPVIVAAVLAAAYGLKAHEIKTAAHLLRMRFDREVAACSRALEHDPSNAAAHARLAEIHEEAGDLAKAVEHGRRVCELEPSEKNRRRLAQLESLGQGRS